jgi:hypothetical protein
MFKIVCPNCEKEYLFQSRSNILVECSFCFETFKSNISIIESLETEAEITGLTIFYQKTQEIIEISLSHKVILGRENFGANVFSKIHFNGKPVVSRKHCSIEFNDGYFYLLDEGSLNGTFYGVNKLCCKTSPQIIEDKSIFYIGEEAFIAQINYKEALKLDQKIEHAKEETKRVNHYRCNESSCGFESQTFNSVCPNCSTYNSLIPIYE